MNKKLSIVVVFLGGIICGCTSELKPRVVVDGGGNVTATIGTALSFDYINSESAKYFWEKYNNATDKKSEQNRIIYELMELVDRDFGKFEIALRSDRAYKDITVKIFSLALSGAASLATESTANVLAALDTGLKGASEAIDKEAFQNHGPELLINKMRADRAVIAARIYKSMTKTDNQYPLQAAILDIGRYYSAGSVTSALASLAAATARPNPTRAYFVAVYIGSTGTTESPAVNARTGRLTVTSMFTGKSMGSWIPFRSPTAGV